MFSVEKHRLKKDFNRAAVTYDNHALLQKNVAHNLFSMALERWPRKLTILDAGAGTGFFSRFSALNNRGFQVIALDIAWRMCELSAREPQTIAVNADMEMLPLKDNSVDAVFSSLALQWVGSPKLALEESKRVLKKDGELLLATIIKGTLSELEQSFAAIGEPHRIGRFTTEETLKKDVAAAGFGNIVVTHQPIILHYPDVLTLLRSIRQIGAASKLEDRNRGTLKRSSIAKLNEIYKLQFLEDGWLKATWNIIYISAKKILSGYFITATGTGIGKTYVTASLAKQLSIAAVKPVISGYNKQEENDTNLLLKAQSKSDVDAISPWRFAAALSPDIAAQREGKTIVFQEVVEWCREQLQKNKQLLIEGAGGVMTPLTERHTMLDWMAALKLPAILVTGSYLGTISHTLTSIVALKTRNVPIQTILLNESAESPMPLEETAEAIERFSGLKPVIVKRGAPVPVSVLR